jgi:hypothetical protein
MNRAPPSAPEREGVLWGWDIVLAVRSGQAWLRTADGEVRGTMPSGPKTNAFVVWVGRSVIVVSEGVEPGDFGAVAEALRDVVGLGSVPVLFDRGRAGVGAVRAVAHGDPSTARREVARAQAYVMVQCAWYEGAGITVELDGQTFGFEIRFERGEGGYWPVVSWYEFSGSASARYGGDLRAGCGRAESRG